MSNTPKVNAQPVNRRALPDIGEVRPLGPDDLAVLDALRAVLARHGALDRFAVTLLHQHFDLADDEMLVETTDAAQRVITIQPMKRAEPMTTIETAWRFGDVDAAGIPTLQCWLQCQKFGELHQISHGRW